VTKHQNLKTLISANRMSSVDDLSTDAQVLFGFLTLIVDIKYRNKYGKPFEDQSNRGYSEKVQSNKVLADQVSPIDNGLLGL